MKILHIITSMNPKLGGVCQVLRNLNPYLIENGVHVEIVSLDNEYDDFDIKDDFIIHKIEWILNDASSTSDEISIDTSGTSVEDLQVFRSASSSVPVFIRVDMRIGGELFQMRRFFD